VSGNAKMYSNRLISAMICSASIPLNIYYNGSAVNGRSRRKRAS
jgi:hypothetical protein